MNATFKKHFYSWILPSVIIILSATVYFSDVVFGDKQIFQSDIVGGLAKGREIVEYRKEFGSEPLWTNSMFGGMPTFQISTEYPNNILSYVQGFLTSLFIENSGIYIIVSLMIGFFALLRSEGVRAELAVVGAIAFGFSAFFIISLAAGHNAKIRAAAYMAPLLIGVLMTLRGRLWLGFALTALFTGMSVHANHFQVTYYTAIPVLCLVIAFGIAAYRTREVLPWLKKVGILAAAATVGLGPNFGNLWSSYAYTKESTRGGYSAIGDPNSKINSGLTYDYAMKWSYGKAESLNLFIPNASGGGSMQSYEDTKLFPILKNDTRVKAEQQRVRLSPQQLNSIANKKTGSAMYLGGEDTVYGAYYMGAIMLFLFIIGLQLVRGPILWGSIAAVLISLILAWGKNAPSFNEPIFEYLPLYNKFRVPSMALVVVFLLIPFIGFMGSERLLKLNREEALKVLRKATFITGGFALLFWLSVGNLISVSSVTDKYDPKIQEILEADRVEILKSSALRTLIFVLLSAAVFWFYINGRIKSLILGVLLGTLVLTDLWMFDKDQLGEEDLVAQADLKTQQVASEADKKILAEDTGHYRVHHLAISPTSDVNTPAFHNAIGGNHAAKLARIQDLITVYLDPAYNEFVTTYNEFVTSGRGITNYNLLNMLNTRWVIYNNDRVDDRRSEACGNAWFPSAMQLVKGPKEAIIALNDFDPRVTAIFEDDMISKTDSAKWATYFGNSNDIQPSMTLKSYAPNKMVYAVSDLRQDQVAVFSEIYYQAPNQGWKAFADGTPIEIKRANYVLRSALIPAGTKEVVFTFEPETYVLGEKLDLAFSILLLFSFGGAVFVETKKRRSIAEKKNEKV